MTETEFSDRLDKIARDTREKVLALLQEAHEMNDKQWFGSSPNERPALPFAAGYRWTKAAETFADITGWISDMVLSEHGTPKSLRRKLRKAMGYVHG